MIRVADIDLASYQSTPMLTAEATLSLCDDLAAAKPDALPANVLKSFVRMTGSGDQLRQAFIGKIEQAGVPLGMQVAFDIVVDRCWSASRRRLEFWMLFGFDGLDLLSDDEQDKLDLEDKREKAELARELDQHWFGEDGLYFLRKPFAQQVTLMASRLGFLEQSEKRAAFEELLGSDLVETLRIFQGRYEAMIRSRASRDDSGANVRELRATLQRHITLYASGLLGLLDDDEPDSIPMVLDALRPMVNARVRRSRTSDQSEAPAEELDQAEGQTENQPASADDNEPNAETETE